MAIDHNDKKYDKYDRDENSTFRTSAKFIIVIQIPILSKYIILTSREII